MDKQVIYVENNSGIPAQYVPGDSPNSKVILKNETSISAEVRSGVVVVDVPKDGLVTITPNDANVPVTVSVRHGKLKPPSIVHRDVLVLGTENEYEWVVVQQPTAIKSADAVAGGNPLPFLRLLPDGKIL